MSNLVGNRRKFVIQNAIDLVNNEGRAVYSRPEEVSLFRTLYDLGDNVLAGIQVKNNPDGSIVLTRRTNVVAATNNNRTTRAKVRTTKRTTATKTVNTEAITRRLSSKGVTVPNSLLSKIGLGTRQSNVYLRPLNNNSFLVMRERGTNPSTQSIRSYADGRVVFTYNTINELLGRRPGNYAKVSFALNGTTKNSIVVTF